MATSADMNPNERALYDLLDRVNSPGYHIDQFLATSALPQNAAPPIQYLTGKTADIKRAFDEGAAKDANRGDNTVTGVGAATPQLKPGPVLAAPTSPGSTDIIANLEQQVRTLEAEAGDDPIKYAAGIARIQDSIAQKKADIYKETQSLMAVKYGIPQLEAAVVMQEANDKRHPLWNVYKTDSNETIAAKQRLQVGRSAADGAINEALKGNPTFAALDNKANSFLKIVEAAYLRSAAKNQAIKDQAELKFDGFTLEQQKLAKEATGLSTPLEVISHMAAIKGDKQKALFEVIEKGDRAVPALALTGNIYAENIMRKREALVSVDPAKTSEQLDTLKSIAVSPAKAKQTFEFLKQQGAFSGEELKKLEKQKILFSDEKSKEPEGEAIRMDLAQRYAQYITTKNFNSDLLAVKSSVPVPQFLLDARADAKLGLTKIDKSTAIALANQAPTFDERKARIASLVNYYADAVAQQNRSAYFKVPALSVEQIRAETGLMAILGKAVSQIGSLSPLSFHDPSMTSEQLQAYQQSQVER